MIILPDVLKGDELVAVRDGLRETKFVDGKTTAGEVARKVKSNHQADPTDPKTQDLQARVRKALDTCVPFQLYTRPAKMTTPMFNRYRVGETYGMHIDEPVMGKGTRMRTDFSFTLFLCEPETYEGGELRVVTGEGERSVKPKAGSVVVYSTGDLHRVMPVQNGERLAAVGWVQSMIRGNTERSVLFDLARLRASMPMDDKRLLLDKAVANLMRLWSEP